MRRAGSLGYSDTLATPTFASGRSSCATSYNDIENAEKRGRGVVIAVEAYFAMMH